MVKDKKEFFSTILGVVVLTLLVFCVIKLVIFDCIIGAKVYDDNDIVIRYHRYINVVLVENNSNTNISFHYQSGKARLDANGDKRRNDIKYIKRSGPWIVGAGEKLRKYTGIKYDKHIFVISNEDGFNDIASFNKLEWF